MKKSVPKRAKEDKNVLSRILGELKRLGKSINSFNEESKQRDLNIIKDLNSLHEQSKSRDLAIMKELNSVRDDLETTKSTLKNFATKDDLSNFATKEDLKNFVTKDDLSNFATKNDLRDLAKLIQVDIKLSEARTSEKIDDLARSVKRQFDRVEAE